MNTELTTRIGNLELQSPIIVGSCPMTEDEIQRISMISNGAGAIVLPSHHVCLNRSADEYLMQLESIAQQTSIPVFASLRTRLESDDWFSLPGRIEAAGAAAIEISLDVCQSDVSDPRKYEDDVVALAEKARDAIKIPLLLKLTRNFTSISDLAKRLHPFVQGIVMFGRLPVVDIELDSLSLSKRWGLTEPGSVVNILEPLMRTRNTYPGMPLIACGGIGSSEDLIKAMLAGANAAMVTSALYRNGTTVLGTLKDGLVKFMSDRGIANIAELHSQCPALDNLDDELDSIEYPSVAKPGDIEQSKNPEEMVECDRYGHPVK